MAEPPCPHFGACGGCTLQDLAEPEYLARKTSSLAAALRRAGFGEVALAPIARTLPGERRRMDLAVRRVRGRIVLGLHALRSAEVTDLSTCLVLHPDLVALFQPLRVLLHGLQGIRRNASVIANRLDSGVDLLLRCDSAPSLTDRIALTEFARTHALPRVAWATDKEAPEPIAVLRPAVTTLSGVTIAPPPGAFLQASASGEQSIVGSVLAGLGALKNKARIAELYAGCGSLTFALAQHVRVAAWEGDAAAIATLRQAVNRATLTGRIALAQRDLARQPLQATELRQFAAVLLDPPFAGAPAQTAQIAAARVPLVVYVSCNPHTLGRDARALQMGGYRVVSAVPIDQFLWSERLECVVAFSR